MRQRQRCDSGLCPASKFMNVARGDKGSVGDTKVAALNFFLDTRGLDFLTEPGKVEVHSPDCLQNQKTSVSLEKRNSRPIAPAKKGHSLNPSTCVVSLLNWPILRLSVFEAR